MGGLFSLSAEAMSIGKWKFHPVIPCYGGISQGLFILYVNDLPDVLASSCMMFANDTKVYTQVNNDA